MLTAWLMTEDERSAGGRRAARRFNAPDKHQILSRRSSASAQAQAGLILQSRSTFNHQPAMDAFVLPGDFGTRQEIYNRRLHDFIQALPEQTLLTSVCAGSWIYGKLGLLNRIAATNRKEPHAAEASSKGEVPIKRLAEIAPKCRISRAHVVDAG